MLRLLLLCLLSLSLISCATTGKKNVAGEDREPPPERQNTLPSSIAEQNKYISLANLSYLQQGKRYFHDGYYKKSMMLFLPLACDGNCEAQYAVGYMYYYGYGVTQDTDVGHFWIKRSAEQGYEPAQDALRLIEKNEVLKHKTKRIGTEF